MKNLKINTEVGEINFSVVTTEKALVGLGWELDGEGDVDVTINVTGTPKEPITMYNYGADSCELPTGDNTKTIEDIRKIIFSGDYSNIEDLSVDTNRCYLSLFSDFDSIANE